MDTFSGLSTIGGKPICTSEFVEKLRQEEEEKKVSKVFIPNKGAQEDGLHSDADLIIYGGNRGGGKANPYYTPVLTPSGFRKMGDLQVGDYICTPYEGIQQVSGIYEQGVNTVYVFHFDDGTELRCMDNHRFYARAHADEPFMVWTARDIMDLYRLDQVPPNAHRRGVLFDVEVPVCGEVEINEEKSPYDLPIHPALVGMALGDGYSRFDTKGVYIKKAYDGGEFYKYGYRVRKARYEKKYFVAGFTTEQRRKIIRARFGAPARIPAEYLNASIESRWFFLRSCMIVAGKARHGHPSYESTNKAFVQDVAQLARSLGAWVKVSEITDDPKKVGMWSAGMIFPDDRNVWVRPIRARTAKVNFDLPGRCPVNPDDSCYTKKILWISKAQKKCNCRCITVTGNDHLYLTDEFIINHNTALMLMEGLYDVTNKHYNSVLFRKNKDDFDNIENESKRWFANLGRYNKSKDDMTWNFKTGAKMSFDHFDMTPKEFEDKYRGQQIAYIGIDELPQIPFEFLKILMGSNRNTIGIRSRIIGTCNPDPLSWLRKFLDWWIADRDTVYPDGQKHPEKHGLPIPWRNGVVRYFFITGDNVDNVVWGNTPEDVYEQARDEIDALWKPELSKLGYDKITFAVKSAVFIKASIMENKALLTNDPNYVSSILNKSPEERAKEWDGNWDAIAIGDDMIQPFHMERCFANAAMLGDKIRRASCDIAGDGGDACVTWFKIGNHIQDVYVCRVDPYNTVPLLKAKLREWGVLEENFVFDLQGMGQVLKGAFPNAIPFNNQEAVAREDKNLYDCLKSQCAYKFAQHTQQGEWSIEPTLLRRQFKSGKSTNELQFILQKERKAIRQDMSKADKGWVLIPKDMMKKRSLVGHSPDFIESLMMFEVFDVKDTDVQIPSFLSGHVRHRRVFKFN